MKMYYLIVSCFCMLAVGQLNAGVSPKPVISKKGKVQELKIPDPCWTNQGAIAFEFKLNKKALTGKHIIMDSPVLGLTFKNKSMWPHLKAAPQPKGERKERVQFVFFNAEQWYHLTVIWNGTNKKFRVYLNGEKQQPSYFDAWTTNKFHGNLAVGNKHIEVRNVCLFNKSLDDESVKHLAENIDLMPLSGEGRTTYSGSIQLDDYNVTLLYEADFKKKQRILHEGDLFEDKKRIKKPVGVDWLLEGNAVAKQKNNAITITSSSNGKARKNHAVLWNTSIFPENFLLEFEMIAKDSREGLGIIFFASTAHNSEQDVFSLHLPKRAGHFGQYMNGALDCYHTSYWASARKQGSRESTNLRKNKGFKLVALGDEVIGRYAHLHKDHSENNLVRLLKVGGKIQLETRGQLVLSWQDDEKNLGAILGKGQIGLRQMGYAEEVSYTMFKVYNITHK